MRYFNFPKRSLWIASKFYKHARPFPHIVIDNVIDGPLIRDINRAIDNVPTSAWRQLDHDAQVNKRWIQDVEALPDPARAVLLAMNERPVLSFLEKLTGIGPLVPDLGFEGGGVHEVSRGGRLEVHADFNLHPATGLHRRLNALLYLNDGWKDEWGGHLELWKRDMSACARRIAPVAGRMVVFSTTDDAFHGHPHALEAPTGVYRRALALYYYTAERPEHEKAPFHWAAWQKRPL